MVTSGDGTRASREAKSLARGTDLRPFALVAALLAAGGSLNAQLLTITHLAGTTGGAGWSDGTGSAARFSSPNGVTVDGSGNAYVADSDNHSIRMVTPAGVVSTLAGLAGSSGSLDGSGSDARFSFPNGVAVDASGNVYVADSGNSTIRKVTSAGVVSTLAGVVGSNGSEDGPGPAARFNFPSGVAVDGSGNVYVADSGNHVIRKVTPAGFVSTLAGLADDRGSADGTGSAARFDRPWGVAVHSSGNVYVTDSRNSTIRKITPSGVVTTLAGLAGSLGTADGRRSTARFHYPAGVAVDGLGTVYVADQWNHSIRRITPSGDVSTVAGLAETPGSADGAGSAARFSEPNGVAVDGSGSVFVADSGNNAIRQITPNGVVSTLSGLAVHHGGADGAGSAAGFYDPSGVTVDGSGIVYVADSFNHAIRKITPAGSVSTIAGLAGTSGSADGNGSAARFDRPTGVATDSAGNVYVADFNNSTIRKITPSGVVSTLAGQAGSLGSADGTGSAARFDYPSGIAVDGSGNVYVADFGNHVIRKITSAGVVSTLAGLAGRSGTRDGTGSVALFHYPTGVAVDGSGNVYVADSFYDTIRKVTPVGAVSTIAGSAGRISGFEGINFSADGTGSAARFASPWGVATDGAGNVYVADLNNHTIRKVTPAGVVSTLAGLAGSSGSMDGTGSAARFDYPSGVAVDRSGNVFIADMGNHCIRKGVPAPGLADVATIDAAYGQVDRARQLDTSPQTATKWFWEEIRRPSGSTATLSSNTIRNPTFTPDVSDLYVFRLTAIDDSGLESITTVSLAASSSGRPGGLPLARLLPIVLDVSGSSVHYTTEMALTNNGTTMLSVSMLYTASLGSKEGSGSVTDSLAPAEQKRIADVLSYLREKGLSIPSQAEQPQQGGTLLVTFSGSSAIDPKLVSATARTAALTTEPQPLGRAGLAYSGLLAIEASTSTLTIYGLRSTPADRTNVAVFNTSSDPVTLKVAVCSGSGDGRCAVFRDAETLPPFGWNQYGSNQILDGNGITRGWVTIERISTTGSFSAYGVINDNTTNDGSFVLPVGDVLVGSTLTVPVLVETPVFRSELVLANKSASPVTLNLGYIESISPPDPAGRITIGGRFDVTLAPFEEQIIPEAVDYLRRNGAKTGTKDAASYGGALRISVSGTTANNVFAGARTTSQSAAGGQFGLFTPCVYSSEEASDEAYLYGLRVDSENRTNVAVVNTGGDLAGPILLKLQAYDGDAGGAPRGAPLHVPLWPGQWAQPANFFRSSDVANGWVKVTRISGTAPWIAYGVVNDGGNPGERTGDGAYVPMVK